MVLLFQGFFRENLRYRCLQTPPTLSPQQPIISQVRILQSAIWLDSASPPHIYYTTQKSSDYIGQHFKQRNNNLQFIRIIMPVVEYTYLRALIWQQNWSHSVMIS